MKTSRKHQVKQQSRRMTNRLQTKTEHHPEFEGANMATKMATEEAYPEREGAHMVINMAAKEAGGMQERRKYGQVSGRVARGCGTTSLQRNDEESNRLNGSREIRWWSSVHHEETTDAARPAGEQGRSTTHCWQPCATTGRTQRCERTTTISSSTSEQKHCLQPVG